MAYHGKRVCPVTAHLPERRLVIMERDDGKEYIDRLVA